MTRLDLCSESTARAVARRFQVRPRRELGQNFLVDPAVRELIVAEVGEGSEVLEVGAGLGGLTQGLLDHGLPVLAVELDPSCVRALGLLRRAHPALRVVHGDILRLDSQTLDLGPEAVVVGNVPYGITGALLPWLLGWRPPPPDLWLLVQREVARRLAAPPGDWSLATLGLRALAQVDTVFDVVPESFWPPPEVHSTLVHIRSRPDADPDWARALADLARPVFQARRKQLHHGLARSLAVDPEDASALLRQVGIDPSRRPGSLDLEEWRRLLASTSSGVPRKR